MLIVLGGRIFGIRMVAIRNDERAASYRITIGPLRGRNRLFVKRAQMDRACAVQPHVVVDEFLGTTVVDLQRAAVDT